MLLNITITICYLNSIQGPHHSKSMDNHGKHVRLLVFVKLRVKFLTVHHAGLVMPVMLVVILIVVIYIVCIDIDMVSKLPMVC